MIFGLAGGRASLKVGRQLCQLHRFSSRNMISSNTFPQRKLAVNGVELNYEQRGNGNHALVCIPGALGTIDSDFRPQLDYFGREGSGFTIVSFDPRGYGKSQPEERFKKEDNFFLTDSEDAYALMHALNLPRFSVLGWSDGGNASLFLAARHPEAVRKLVVWGANSYITDEDVALFENTRDVSNWSEKMRSSLFRVYGDSLQDLWSQWLDSCISFKEKTNGDICKGELSKIICPTLVLHGAKDPMVPDFHPRYIHGHVIGSELEVMEEGKHNIHLRYHMEFNKMVEQFLLN